MENFLVGELIWITGASSVVDMNLSKMWQREVVEKRVKLRGKLIRK